MSSCYDHKGFVYAIKYGSQMSTLTAIGEAVDNSLAYGASNVDICIKDNNSICIRDDGIGFAELAVAHTPFKSDNTGNVNVIGEYGFGFHAMVYFLASMDAVIYIISRNKATVLSCKEAVPFSPHSSDITRNQENLIKQYYDEGFEENKTYILISQIDSKIGMDLNEVRSFLEYTYSNTTQCIRLNEEYIKKLSLIPDNSFHFELFYLPNDSSNEYSAFIVSEKKNNKNTYKKILISTKKTQRDFELTAMRSLTGKQKTISARLFTDLDKQKVGEIFVKHCDNDDDIKGLILSTHNKNLDCVPVPTNKNCSSTEIGEICSRMRVLFNCEPGVIKANMNKSVVNASTLHTMFTNTDIFLALMKTLTFVKPVISKILKKEKQEKKEKKAQQESEEEESEVEESEDDTESEQEQIDSESEQEHVDSESEQEQVDSKSEQEHVDSETEQGQNESEGDTDEEVRDNGPSVVDRRRNEAVYLTKSQILKDIQKIRDFANTIEDYDAKNAYIEDMVDLLGNMVYGKYLKNNLLSITAMNLGVDKLISIYHEVEKDRPDESPGMGGSLMQRFKDRHQI
tara:strand:+ start:82 stop:1791 length:1710 start_codon:yes stop_codon:yes gene_type:complete